MAAARKTLGWTYPPFEVPEAIRAGWDHAPRARQRERAVARARSRATRRRYPELAAEFERRMRGRSAGRTGRDTRDRRCEALLKQSAPQATRQSSQAVLNVLGPALPELLGGSADLTGSNNTLFKGAAHHHRRRMRAATTCTTACASSA